MRHHEELYALDDGAPLLTVLSYGIGQDSTALLHRLLRDAEAKRQYAPGRFIVIASDTGNEHEHTYEYLPTTRAACEAVGVPFFFLKQDAGFHSEAWATLTHQWERNDTVGFKAGRKSCTDNLKIAPFYRFLSWHVQQTFDVYTTGSLALERFAQYYGPIRVLIGFAADETDRVSDSATWPAWRQASITMAYPLIDWGWTRADCVTYLQQIGVPVPFPSNCKYCPFSTDLDVLWLAHHEPASFEQWVAYEVAKLRKFAHLGAKNYGVFGRRTLPQVLADARQKYADLSAAEITRIKFERGHCVRSRY